MDSYHSYISLYVIVLVVTQTCEGLLQSDYTKVLVVVGSGSLLDTSDSINQRQCSMACLRENCRGFGVKRVTKGYKKCVMSTDDRDYPEGTWDIHCRISLGHNGELRQGVWIP